MQEKTRHLVNPIAVEHCVLKVGDWTARILDISYVRLVVEAVTEAPGSAEGAAEIETVGTASPETVAVAEVVPAPAPCPFKVDEVFEGELYLERSHFRAFLRLRAEGDGWLRLSFEKLVPSVKAYLRAFLTPKKIGESIFEDWRNADIRHFHGLNDSELWFNGGGTVVFTHLDAVKPDHQFILRVSEGRGSLLAGRIARTDYMSLSSIEGELPLSSLTDRETVARLGECRDILTNFRPVGQLEYNLKQRLLRIISDHLYSTSHKVEMIPVRPRQPTP